MAQIRIDAVTPTASGKAWRVRSGAEWYNAFKDSGIEAHVGKVIDAEISTHEKYGKGIEKYKVVTQTTGALPVPQMAIPNQGLGVAPYWLAFASNVVAHAISAGLIKEPSDIKVWFLAAKHAVDGD